MARTYAYALLGAVIATFTVTPVLASILLPAHVEEVETFVVRRIRSLYRPCWCSRRQLSPRRGRCRGISGAVFQSRVAARHRIPAQAGGGQLWIRAVMPPTITLEAVWIRWQDPRRDRDLSASRPCFEQGRGDEGTDPDGSFLADLCPAQPTDEWPQG